VTRRPILSGKTGRWALDVLCVWELIGLHTNLIPPITGVVQPRQRQRAVVTIVCVVLGIVAHHLLWEEPGIVEPCWLSVRLRSRRVALVSPILRTGTS
jgi:hypothetical protein